MIESLNFGLVLSIKQNPRLTTSHNVSRAQNGIVTSLRMHHLGNSIQIPNPKIPSKSQNPLQTSSQAPKMGLSHRKFHPNPKTPSKSQNPKTHCTQLLTTSDAPKMGLPPV